MKDIKSDVIDSSILDEETLLKLRISQNKKEVKLVEKKERKARHLLRIKSKPRIKADLKDFRKEKINNIKSTFKKILSVRKEYKINIKGISKEEKIKLKESFKNRINSIIDEYQLRRYDIYTRRNNYINDARAKGEMYKLDMKEWMYALIFLLPWIIGFLIFTLYPIIQTMIYSFSNVSITPYGIKLDFVGMVNYIYAFNSDVDFIDALTNYLTKIILYVPVIVVISLFIALLLNSRIKGTSIFRTIFFIPVVITSGPVISIFIKQGVASFNNVDKIIDLSSLQEVLPAFLYNALNFLTSEFIMILWMCGIQILVFMTGLQKIDKSVYEAASIDGAGAWEKFWKVTLPSINSLVVINVVFTVVMESISSLNPIIEKIQTDMIGSGEGKGYGYASALAYIYFMFMILVLVVFVFLFIKKGSRKKYE